MANTIEEGNIPNELFPAHLIGYNRTASGDMLIDQYFSKAESDRAYQIPECNTYTDLWMLPLFGDHILNVVNYHR